MRSSRSGPLLAITLTLLLLAARSALAATASEADRIDWPRPDSTVAGRVEVRGTAGSAGASFRSYRLEYGAGRTPSAWRAIGPDRDHSVDRAVLGIWDATGLEPGAYTLRLLVFDESGHRTEARVTVQVARTETAAPAGETGPPTAESAPAVEPSEATEPVGQPPLSSTEPEAVEEPTTPDVAGGSPGSVVEQAAVVLPPPPIQPPFPPAAFRCPMLYYHEVPTRAGLAGQLVALLQAGYQPVSMGRLVDGLEGRVEPPPNCLVLTFDDGLASQISGALPVLVQFGVPATFFVMPDFQDGIHRYMTPHDFRLLRDAGMEIGSHTLNHPSLPGLLRLSLGALQSELVESKARLEAELGQRVDLLAYPNGSWDPPTAEEVRLAGYRAAASTSRGTWQHPHERYWLRRIRADAWEPPETVLARLDGDH